MINPLSGQNYRYHYSALPAAQPANTVSLRPQDIFPVADKITIAGTKRLQELMPKECKT